MTLRCTCGRPTDAYVCTSCHDGYRDHLTNLPWLLHQLDLVASKRVRYTTSRGSSDQFPLPLNLAAIDHKRNIRNHLVTTIRILAEPTNLDYPANTYRAMRRWLLDNHTVIPLRPEGPDIIDEMATLATRGESLVDRPPDTIYAGVCPCGLAIHAPADATWYRCPCGEQTNIDDAISARTHRARAEFLTITEICTLSPIPRRTIRSWIARGRLTTGGTTIEGRPAYRYGDAINLWDDAKRRADTGRVA